VSKAFQGRHGRAYLFGHVINVSLGPKEDRMLTTGLHTVCDIFWSESHTTSMSGSAHAELLLTPCRCACCLCSVQCETNIGWFYEEAFEESQKYKVAYTERAQMHLQHKEAAKGKSAAVSPLVLCHLCCLCAGGQIHH